MSVGKGIVVKVGLILVLGIWLNPDLYVAEGLWCERAPHGMMNIAKTPNDINNGFKIAISGDPEKPDKYIPGAVYTVRIQGPSGDKFTGFLLVAEPTDGLSPESSAGNFQLSKSDSFARFSDMCPHAVQHASEVPKTEVQVQWIAPEVATGCVSFRATVIKNKGQWFMDDAGLTKSLCPETEVGEELTEDAEPCCACDEAKYELTFEGQWSPLTHPKEFPADAWRVHFSDIVGASHSPSFKFWQQNEPASEGLRQLAEAGDSKDLERELKDESTHIRTIIKARGLRHPNFYGHKTFAVFRADKDNNLISLVSKIAPSPDWFVGVSALNLCLRNCSWIDSKVIPLYPWDAGTDGGITYLSEKNPIIPRERISRIVWNPRPESPFYDPSGNMVKPFAKLRIQKQRSYERTCAEDSHRVNPPTFSQDWEEEEDSQEDRPECAVSPWVDGPCSATCGKGVLLRRRQFHDANAKDLGCTRKLTETVACDSRIPCNTQTYTPSTYGHHRGGSGSGSQVSYGSLPPSSSGGREDACATTGWTAWGLCSKPCGQGIKRRRREFLNPNLAAAHSCNHEMLIANEPCFGTGPHCNEQEQVMPGCETTEWSDWEPCNATICGTGIMKRTRMFVVPARAYGAQCKVSLMDTEQCMGRIPDCDDPQAIKEICMLPMDSGTCSGTKYTRWYFDGKACSKFTYSGCQGNANMFDNKEDCEKTCGSLREPEPMQRHQSHGGYRYKTINHVSQPPSFSNNVPPANTNPYGTTSYTSGFSGRDSNTMYGMTRQSSSQSPFNNDSPVAAIDCEVSEWGMWSKCSVDCGRGHKYRTRYPTRLAQNGGIPCPKLEQRRKCKGINCPSNHPHSYHQYGPSSSSSDYGSHNTHGHGHGHYNYNYDGYIN